MRRNSEFVICPFNPNHVMKSTRFQRHLTECETKHRGQGFSRCVFNPCHIIKAEDKMKHLLSCDSLFDDNIFNGLQQITNANKSLDQQLHMTTSNNAYGVSVDDNGFHGEPLLKVKNWLNSEVTLDKNGTLTPPNYDQDIASKDGSRNSDITQNIKCLSVSPPLRKASYFNEKRKRYQSQHGELDININPDDSISNVGVNDSVGDLPSSNNTEHGFISNRSFETRDSDGVSDKTIISRMDLVTSIVTTDKQISSSVNIVSDSPQSSVVSSSFKDNESVFLDMKSNISSYGSLATAARMRNLRKLKAISTLNSKDKPGMTSVGVQTEKFCCCGL